MLACMRVHLHFAGPVFIFVFVFAVLLSPATHSQVPAAAPSAVEVAPSPQYEFAVATIKPADKSEGVQSFWQNTADGFRAITPPIALLTS